MTGRGDAGAAAAGALCRVAAAAAAYGAAWGVRFHLLPGLAPLKGNVEVLPPFYLQAMPVAILATLVAARAAGPGSSADPSAPRAEARHHLAAAALATLLLMAVALLAKDVFQYSRAFLAIYGGLLAFALPAGDALARRLLSSRGAPRETVLLVGGAAPAAALASGLSSGGGPPPEILGRAGPPGEAPGAPPLLGPLQEAARIAAERGVRRVVVLDDALADPGADALFRALSDGTADVGMAWRLPRPAGFPAPLLSAAGEFAVAAYWETPLRGGGAALKRAMDAVLSALLLLLLSPLMLLIAAVVRMTSPGPALHRQERVGLDGRTFTMLKFRTMVAGAEDATGPVFASPGDSRRTAPGAFLRRFSLDELPQFWNVLRGDMSLVGPRPERPAVVERFRREHPGYMLRHSLRAGITGWAQVHGLRGRSSIEDRLAYDLEYARRWSLLLDAEILVRTAFQVLSGRNAY